MDVDLEASKMAWLLPPLVLIELALFCTGVITEIVEERSRKFLSGLVTVLSDEAFDGTGDGLWWSEGSPRAQAGGSS